MAWRNVHRLQPKTLLAPSQAWPNVRQAAATQNIHTLPIENSNVRHTASCRPIREKLEGNLAMVAGMLFLSCLSTVDWLQDEQFGFQREVESSLLKVHFKHLLQLFLESFSHVTIHVHSNVRQSPKQLNTVSCIPHGEGIWMDREVYQLKQPLCSMAQHQIQHF